MDAKLMVSKICPVITEYVAVNKHDTMQRFAKFKKIMRSGFKNFKVVIFNERQNKYKGI